MDSKPAEHAAAASLWQRRAPDLIAVLIALGLSPLLLWGLPNRSADGLLFGPSAAWPAERFAAAQRVAALREREAGADTDLDPLHRAMLPVNLTVGDSARAEILLRYRLYSRQPDEMITFRALQRMQPRAGDFDPKLYQYGGAWIYLVGAVLGAGAATGLLTLTSDLTVYLARPEAFAAFYVAARGIALLAGLASMLALVRLARALAPDRSAALFAVLIAGLTPLLITFSLEAKPHMPSTAALLWATVFALRLAEHGRLRDALLLGALSGLAFGFVLTGLAAALLWPAVLFGAWGSRARSLRLVAQRLLLAASLGVAVYAMTNPYVLYNLAFARGALSSNLTNSTDMYTIGRLGDGAARVSTLLVAGVGPATLLLGLIGAAWLAWRSPRRTSVVLAPAVGLLLLCVALGAGKPAEFARFLLLPGMVLTLAASAVLGAVWRRQRILATLLVALAIGLARPDAYLRSFAIDAFGRESRRFAAEWIENHISIDLPIGVLQEPAPYAVPPIDFAQRTVELLPPMPPVSNASPLPPWLVLTADDLAAAPGTWWRSEYELVKTFGATGFWRTPITWADKPVFVLRRVAPGSSPS